VYFVLDSPQFPISNIQKVAGSAGRIKNTKAVQLGQKTLKILDLTGSRNTFTPWRDNRRANDLHDVSLAGEMGTVSMPFSGRH
jgi:hypothetical protein